MKGIIFLVVVTLISFAYGLDHCTKTQNLDESCGKNGKCKNPECVLQTTTTTTAPATTMGTGPGANKSSSTVAPTTTSTATTTTAKRRKREVLKAFPANCTSTCGAPRVCLYKCTGESSHSGSQKHVLSPLVLLVGVVAKLLIG